MKLRNTSVSAGIAAVSVAIAVVAGAGNAQAQTQDSWIGSLNANGINYLQYSTISNTPLFASSRIYTLTGSPVPQGTIGARARLFKSGALCQATNWKYNPSTAASVTATTAGDCGSGSYNSHGFVAAWKGGDEGYNEVFTFPTNPLGYTNGAATTAPAQSASRTPDGRTIGSADQAGNLPELVRAIATNGRTGYIESRHIDTPAAKSPQSARSSGTQNVSVFDQDGKTVVGQFVIR